MVSIQYMLVIILFPAEKYYSKITGVFWGSERLSHMLKNKQKTPALSLNHRCVGLGSFIFFHRDPAFSRIWSGEEEISLHIPCIQTIWSDADSFSQLNINSVNHQL